MREKQPVRDEIIVIPQTVLERREGLLIVLQRVDVLSCAAVGQAEGRDGHDGVGKLQKSVERNEVSADGPYRREMGGLPLEKVGAQSHTATLKPM